ncbi:MAG: type II secretion system protein GspG [Planctomycetota bacterium]|jgi:general secretion pathway protein G
MRLQFHRVPAYLLGASIVYGAGGTAPLPETEVGSPADAVERYMRATEEPGRSIALEMAARTFAPSGGSGPTVALVGVSHIGERQLYEAVQAFLDEHEVVLYESVKPAGAGGAGGKDDRERIETTRAAMRFVAGLVESHRRAVDRYPGGIDELARFATEQDPRLAEWLAVAMVDAWGGRVTYRVGAEGQQFTLLSLGADGRPGGEGADADLRVSRDDSVPPTGPGPAADNLQAELAKALGLEFQLDALSYDRPAFRCSDMAMDQLERALREKGVDFAPISGSLAGSSLPGRLAIYLLRLIRAADVFFDGAIADTLKVVLIELFSDEAVLEYSLKQFGGGFEEVIIDQRNQVVVDQVKAILDRERDVDSVAILYGAAHMPDMERRLTEQLGYRSIGERWFTAFKVDLKRSAMTAGQLKSIRRMVRYQLRQLVPPKPSQEDR